MGRYSEQISKMVNNKTSINQALSDKLSDTVDVKFSGMADKIREIEGKPEETYNFDVTIRGLNFLSAKIDFTRKGQTKSISFNTESREYKGNIELAYGTYKVKFDVELKHYPDNGFSLEFNTTTKYNVYEGTLDLKKTSQSFSWDNFELTKNDKKIDALFSNVSI